ncbi:MAG: hypothetical protein LAP21_05475 [Acidobacteriia bacterium]|nr:hypothetical protein [Terriglobia bacterium]
MKKAVLVMTLLAITAGTWAKGQGKDKTAPKKVSSNRTADSGSFGIFMNGKRVGTETFRIEEGTEVSVATSDIKVDDGTTKAEQSSEMRVAPDGNLRYYRWRSTVPTQEETVVEPKDDLLMEHITPADQKKMDLPHILPASTSILDDNFFSHREILAWRYLATSCITQEGRRSCSRALFGILVPRQHIAVNASVELVGRNVINIKGVEQELNELKVDTGGDLWLIWIDDKLKVQKMAIPAEKVEIVRD